MLPWPRPPLVQRSTFVNLQVRRQYCSPQIILICRSSITNVQVMEDDIASFIVSHQPPLALYLHLCEFICVMAQEAIFVHVLVEVIDGLAQA